MTQVGQIKTDIFILLRRIKQDNSLLNLFLKIIFLIASLFIKIIRENQFNPCHPCSKNFCGYTIGNKSGI